MQLKTRTNKHPATVLFRYAVYTCWIVGCAGCTSLNNPLPQTFGINSGARVPPPGTNSFSTPGNYTQGAGAGVGTPLNNSLPVNGGVSGPKTSFVNPIEQPTNQILNTLNSAQQQMMLATSQARDSVNRAAESLNSQVEAAGGRIDRLGQGVVQASAIITEAARSPAPQDEQTEKPIVDTNASWRSPVIR